MLVVAFAKRLSSSTGCKLLLKLVAQNIVIKSFILNCSVFFVRLRIQDIVLEKVDTVLIRVYFLAPVVTKC